MFKSKRVLSVLLIVLMVMSMCSSMFTVGAVASGETEDKFIYRPFKPLSTAPKWSSTPSTGVSFVCNADSWTKAKDGEFVYLDYGVNPGDEPEVYQLVKGQNAFSSVADALTYSSSTDIKIGPGTYADKVTVLKNGYTFYGNYAGISPNSDFESLTNFYDVPLNPARSDSSLETVITNTWNWQKTTSYITCDGFTLSGKGQFFASYSGGNCTNNAFYNNIFTAQTTYGINCDYGTNYNTIVKNNRIVDNTASMLFVFGGGFFNLDMQYNYFANNTGKNMKFTSIGNNNGIESQLNISNNIFNNCSSFIDMQYDHSHGGKANLLYNRITDNVFYDCGKSAGTIMSINYHPDQSGSYDPNVDNMDPSSKTFISGNTFYKIPSGVSPVKLNGADTIKTKTFEYKVSVVGNRFVFESESGGKAITCTIYGTLDASKNFVGECSKGIGNEKVVAEVEAAFDVASNISSYVTMPYYLDYEMTTLSAVVALNPGDEDANLAAGVAPNGVIVDNDRMEIAVTVQDGVETIDLSGVVEADNTTYKVYKDFLLTNELEDGKLNLTGDRTTAYIVATNNETNVTTVYTVIVIANTDKTKTELRELVYAPTDEVHNDVLVDGKTWTVTLDSQYLYFPFTLEVSPSATYKLYIDKELKNEYADEYFYMQPDAPTVIYAAITSGDGKTTSTYELNFNRAGMDKYDAQVISAITPEENILIFNNERKRITYRPHIMATDVVFDFKVSDNATYTIYEDKALTKVLSTSEEPKAITVPDAISTFYIKVESKFGYSQTYTFMTYNDVKSTDNVITGVTGLDVTIENNVITINANSTLAVVNAHFETDVFADVKVYADEDKTFALEPNVQYITVNKREVEVRTFQLGNSARKSYFYITVTSETGVPNDYLVILKKQNVSGAIAFDDVKSTHWAKKFIDKASELGLMTGTQNVEINTYSFYPNNNMSRQEVAVVLCTMMGIEPYSFRGVAIGTVFEDANNIPEWSYNYIKAVYALGSMKGDGKNFNYKASITRQEFFVAVAGILNLDLDAAKDYSLSSFKDAGDVSSWAVASTKAVVEAGIIEGSGGKLNPRDNITRAEVATIISKCHKLTK